jgi:sulfoxide reductase catalytic subunit YedY
MDEAMHPLTSSPSGLYGKTLMNQNGAPIRLVVPWKYGFKGIKSIVQIKFVEKQPSTSWNISWPEAYGFYSNVNPDGRTSALEPGPVRSGCHRCSRPTRRRCSTVYGDQVASMYAGMDLRKNY